MNTEAHKEVGGLYVRVLEVEAAGGGQDREGTQQHACTQLRPAAVHHEHLETENKPAALKGSSSGDKDVISKNI